MKIVAPWEQRLSMRRGRPAGNLRGRQIRPLRRRERLVDRDCPCRQPAPNGRPGFEASAKLHKTTPAIRSPKRRRLRRVELRPAKQHRQIDIRNGRATPLPEPAAAQLVLKKIEMLAKTAPQPVTEELDLCA